MREFGYLAEGFWWDIWVGDSKLKDLYPTPFRIVAHKYASVADLWGRQGGGDGCFFFFFLIDKKEDILKRVVKKAAQGMRKVYNYHQPPPQKHQDTKKEIQPARPH